MNDRYLALRRLRGVTLWDCLRRGLRIPLQALQALQDTDAGLAHAVSRGLHGHDLHARNPMVHRGRGLIVDISDLLDPAPCRAWQDLRRAQDQLCTAHGSLPRSAGSRSTAQWAARGVPGAAPPGAAGLRTAT